jgi:hypothetical protein
MDIAMRSRALIAACFALAWLAVTVPAFAEKPPDLARTKFKEIAKYLNLTTGQQVTIKPDVEHIQEIVKQADKQGGSPGYGGGGRTPVGGSRWGGGIGGSPGGTQVGEREQRRTQRVEWQKEITNRVEEIKSLLTPEQAEKFKAIQVPNLMASPAGGRG